jgi:hypothetical protein
MIAPLRVRRVETWQDAAEGSELHSAGRALDTRRAELRAYEDRIALARSRLADAQMVLEHAAPDGDDLAMGKAANALARVWVAEANLPRLEAARDQIAGVTVGLKRDLDAMLSKYAELARQVETRKSHWTDSTETLGAGMIAEKLARLHILVGPPDAR